MLSNIPYEQIISLKPKTSYPEQAVDEIKAISIDKNNWDLKGSFSFRASKYPSDIDVSDVFVQCCDKDATIDNFVKKIQEIVSNTLRANHWFLELKAGIDKRYDINTKRPNHEILSIIDNLHLERLLSDEDYIVAYNILNKEDHDELEHEILTEMLRQHATLRWTSDEVLFGYKILPGGVGISLSDAVKSSKAINIELIEVINDKFTEISNFFNLLYYSTDGQVHTINSPQESYNDFPSFFKKELRKNIQKLFYSKLEANYLKLAKRYFSYGKFFKDIHLVEVVYPLLNSNIGLAGQIKGELATIEKLIMNVRFDSIPISTLKYQLESIKSRLANIIEIPDDILEEFNKNINEILITTYITPNLVLEEINPIKKYLSKFTNELSYTYLKKHKLVPPPKYLLP
jgi:hypothetical protein